MNWYGRVQNELVRCVNRGELCQRMRKKHSNQDTENPSFELIFGFRLKEAAAELSIYQKVGELQNSAIFIEY